MSDDLDPAKFLLVRTTNQHGRPFFRRAGIVFWADRWRLIQRGDADDLEAATPVVGPESLERILLETKERVMPNGIGQPLIGPPMLIMKLPNAAELREHLDMLAPAADSVESLAAQNAKLAAQNAELEARLVRLELAAQQGASPLSSAAPGKQTKAKE